MKIDDYQKEFVHDTKRWIEIIYSVSVKLLNEQILLQKLTNDRSVKQYPEVIA